MNGSPKLKVYEDNEALKSIISGLKMNLGEYRELSAAKDKRIAQLEGLLSQDTSEWKSAAFQKIKTLEAKLRKDIGITINPDDGHFDI